MEHVKVYNLNPEVQKHLIMQFTGQDEGFVQFGEEKYLLPKRYFGHQDIVKQMKIRKEDIWVTSFPRSGTTWTQELVWLVTNDMDFKKAGESALVNKYIFLELFSMITEKQELTHDKNEMIKNILKKGYLQAEETIGRRYFKSHLPFSLLPPNLLDISKIVYIARDPRDVAVSYYYHNVYFQEQGYSGDFKNYWKLFRNDLVIWAPYFSHLKEAWKLRHHPNMMFLFYEDLSNDIEAVIRRVVKFFGKDYDDDKIQKLCCHLHLDMMRKSKSVIPDWWAKDGTSKSDENAFIRKGKVGNWCSYFDEEMKNDAEIWIKENLKGTDISFPSF